MLSTFPRDGSPTEATVNYPRRILKGATAGLAGGLVLLPVLVMQDALPLIGQVVGHPTSGTGAALHFAVSAFVGAAFALSFGRSYRSLRTGVWLGVAYGALLWMVGPLSLVPLMLRVTGMTTGPDASILGPALSIGGHVIFGAVLGLTYSILRRPVASARVSGLDPYSEGGAVLNASPTDPWTQAS